MCVYMYVYYFLEVDSYFLYWNWIPETVGLILGCALIHKCIYNLPSENQGMWQDLNRSFYILWGTRMQWEGLGTMEHLSGAT